MSTDETPHTEHTRGPNAGVGSADTPDIPQSSAHTSPSGPPAEPDREQVVSEWRAAWPAEDIRSQFAAPTFEYLCDATHRDGRVKFLPWTSQWDPEDRKWRTGGLYEFMGRGPRDEHGIPKHTWPPTPADQAPDKRRSEWDGKTLVLRCPTCRGEVRLSPKRRDATLDVVALQAQLRRPKRDRPGTYRTTLETIRTILRVS